MAIATIVEHPGLSREQAEQIQARVRATGPVPPEGARLVLGGPADPGWRVITVWDSVDARDRFFAERLTPAYEETGLSFQAAKLTHFDVQLLSVGDLTGAMQPA